MAPLWSQHPLNKCLLLASLIVVGPAFADPSGEPTPIPIVGESTGFVASVAPKWEAHFQETLWVHQNIQEIYAMLLWAHYPRERPIVLYVDNTGCGRVWTQWTVPAPPSVRLHLSPERVSQFKQRMAELDADHLPLYLGSPALRTITMTDYQYVHLTRTGGWRVNFRLPREPYSLLLESFRELIRPPDAKS